MHLHVLYISALHLDALRLAIEAWEVSCLVWHSLASYGRLGMFKYSAINLLHNRHLL